MVSIWSNRHREVSFPQGAAYLHWSILQAHFQTACSPKPGLDFSSAKRISFLTLKLLSHSWLRSNHGKFWVTENHLSPAVLGQCLGSFGQWNTNTIIASSFPAAVLQLCQPLTQIKILLSVLQCCLMSDKCW